MRTSPGFNDTAREKNWPVVHDDRLAFDLREQQFVHAYWRAKSAGRDMPRRSDIAPRDLKACLPNLGLIDLGDGTRGPRVRLQGTALVGLVGEMTGREIDAAVQPGLRDRWHACFAETLRVRAPRRFLTRFDSDGIGYRIADTFLAPLTNETGEPRFILACVYLRKGETWDDFALKAAPLAVSGR